MLTWKTRVQEVNNRIYFSGIIDVMIELDYAEALKTEFYMEIQSEVFGFNLTIYIWNYL